MNTPRITVLMPVYNGLPFLREAVESVLNQTFTDFEFLIIVDGSTDGSLEYLQSCVDSRIRIVVNEKNLGTAGTMNKGIELATAPYIARLDQDDISLPRRLEAQLAYLENHPEMDIICSWEYGIDAQSRRVRNWRGAVENYGAYLGLLALGLCPIWHPSIMFRREAMIKAGGYDGTYSPVEDFECTMRLALKGHWGGIVPEYLVGQRHHGQRQSVTKLARQIEMRKKVHNEMINRFFTGPERELLVMFLRMDKEFWGEGRSKDGVCRTVAELSHLLENMRCELKLTDQEFIALKRVVYKRFGRGLLAVEKLRKFPEPLFFAIFFCLSPLLSPKLRSIATVAYEIYQEIRYPGRLLRAGVERRDALQKL